MSGSSDQYSQFNAAAFAGPCMGALAMNPAGICSSDVPTTRPIYQLRGTCG